MWVLLRVLSRCRRLTSCRVLIWRKGLRSSVGPFYRSTNPILKGLILTISQRPCLLTPTTWISVVLQMLVAQKHSSSGTDLLKASIFLYVSSSKIMSFKELIHFFQVFKSVGIELFIILFKYYLFTTQVVRNDGPFISNIRNLCPLFFLS